MSPWLIIQWTAALLLVFFTVFYIGGKLINMISKFFNWLWKQ